MPSPKTRFIEYHCKTACNRVKGRFPYQWDLNIYRGCIHGCIYCYALYSHQYLEHKDFYRDIYVKTNIVETLEKQLCHPKWQNSLLNLGGVTDNYQAAEAKYKIMPDVLRLLIKHKVPVIISTKSDLILRDIELIDQLSRTTFVNIATTVITTERDLEKKLEPKTVSSRRRFAMLKEFRRTNASTGIHMMPIIPFLTDQEHALEAVFAAAKTSEAQYLIAGYLYLRGPTRTWFFDMIRKDFPETQARIRALFMNRQLYQAHKATRYPFLAQLRNRYQLSDYQKIFRTSAIIPRSGQSEPEQYSFNFEV